jgi:pimeloyl-ACP methyl ester carboxylesterase
VAQIVLLHGAFRGAWSWDRVTPLLVAAGHEVHAPDLPGAGARYRPDEPPTGLAETISDVARLLVEADLRHVILAGHSQGGFVARAVSERVAERIAVLAYLDAPVPADGQTALDLLPATLRPPAPPEPSWVDPPPARADADLDPPTAALLAAHLTPASTALSLEPVVLRNPYALALPERFAFCARTPDSYPCVTTRAQLDAEGTPYAVLDASHDAPLTHPALVAAWLLNVAEAASR